jgi:hypothetical protein
MTTETICSKLAIRKESSTLIFFWQKTSRQAGKIYIMCEEGCREASVMLSLEVVAMRMPHMG